MWKPGDVVALRGIYNQHVSYIQSAVIVQDQPEEVALAILPGAECFAPEGYINGKHGTSGEWDRWGEYKRGTWNMERYTWRKNRLLILLQGNLEHGEVHLADESFADPAPAGKVLCQLLFLAGG